MNPVRSVALLLALAASVASAQTPTYFSVTAGAHPHDVAATREPGGPVYYTAQMTGKLGILDPATGKVDETVRPGSPMADRTRSFASIRKRTRSPCGSCRRRRPAPT